MNKDDTKGIINLHLMRGLPRSGKSTEAKKISILLGTLLASSMHCMQNINSKEN